MGKQKSKAAEFDCVYNKGVMCDTRNKCLVCGFNPIVHDYRVYKIRKRLEAEQRRREACW